MATPQLVISGSIAIDRIMNFTGTYQDLIHHKKLDALSVSVFLDSMKVAEGGIGANICYSMALLGEQPILLGSVGEDAKSYVEALKNAGVNTNYVHISQLPTASFNVMTDSDNNQIGGFYPGAMSDAESLDLTPWSGSDTILCLSAHDPKAMRHQIEQCKELSIRLFYDPGQQVSNVGGDDLRAGVKAAEVLIVNEYEYSLLSEKTGLDAHEIETTVPLVIVTHGKDGSVFSGTSLTTPIQLHIAKTSHIVDPTGAGDAYRAGFLYGYLRKWDVTKCGQLGSVLASIIIEQYGTQYRFALSDVEQRYTASYDSVLALSSN
jgi:adenosine kinase